MNIVYIDGYVYLQMIILIYEVFDRISNRLSVFDAEQKNLAIRHNDSVRQILKLLHYPMSS